MTIFKAEPEAFLNETLSKHIQMFVPHNNDLSKCKYIGATKLAVPEYGNIPIQFEIVALTITEAFEKYDEYLTVEIERLKEDQAAEAIVVPKNDIII